MAGDSISGSVFSADQLRLLRATRARRMRESGQPPRVGLVRREHTGPVVASSSQQAMWFTYRLLGQDTTETNTENDLLRTPTRQEHGSTDVVQRLGNGSIQGFGSSRSLSRT